MSRGADANYAWVMTSSPRASDPAAGPAPAPAPELARHDWLEAARQSVPLPRLDTGPGEAAGSREAADVLADVIARGGADLSATEYAERQLANADHLGLLDSMWQDAITRPRTERYRQILRDVVPPAYEADPGKPPTATWLWRTLRAVEAAGLDARQIMQAAIDSRLLTGARDVAAVIDARIRKQADVEHLVPPSASDGRRDCSRRFRG